MADVSAIVRDLDAEGDEVDALNLVPEKYRGLDRFEARKQVIADINALGLSVSTLHSEIDPETAVPAEVWHSPTESLTGCLANGRRIQLTREGQTLYDLALPLIEGFDGIDESFRGKLVGMDAGELTIAAGTSTIQYLLPNLVQAFRERYPKVRLHLVNVTGNEGLTMMRTDTADFAVGSMIDVPNDLAYEAVYHFDPMLITPPNHPLMQKTDIRLEDLSPYGLILPARRLTTYRLVDLIFQQARVPYQVGIEVGGWEVIKQYVSMGLGISIVTGICLRPEDRLEVRNMRAWFPQRSYGVVMRKGKYLSPQARDFIDLIKPGLFTRRDWFESGHSER